MRVALSKPLLVITIISYLAVLIYMGVNYHG